MGKVKKDWQDIEWVLRLFDERILWDGNFIDQVLSVAEEQMEQKNLLITKGYNLKMIAERVCSVASLKNTRRYCESFFT